MKKIFVILCAVFITACAQQTPSNTLILKYDNYTPSNDIDREIEHLYAVFFKSRAEELKNKYYSYNLNTLKKNMRKKGRNEAQTELTALMLKSFIDTLSLTDEKILDDVKLLCKEAYSLEQLQLLNKLYSSHEFIEITQKNHNIHIDFDRAVLKHIKVLDNEIKKKFLKAKESIS